MKSPNSQFHLFGRIKSMPRFIFISLFILTNSFIYSQQLAFPTANGGGSNATGGRGQSVYHVTNLNNSGTGSFRDAVSQGNRTIVFDLSGTILLTSNLTIGADNITIAGQTAPLGGITICGANLIFDGADNLIIRYIRHRLNLNDYSWGGTDAVRFKNSDNVILDHCSFSWGTDETVTFWQNSNNITIQNCVIGEGKTGSIFGDSDNASMNNNLSYLRNIIYNTTHRTPNVNSNGRVDIVNNVVFNWKYRLSRVSGNIQLNHIGNYYSLGSLNSIADIGNMVYASVPNSSIYTKDNIVDNEGAILMSKTDDNWTGLWQDWNSGSYPHVQADEAKRSSTKFTDMINPPIIIDTDIIVSTLTTDCGANAVLDENGTKVESIDNVDTAYFADVLSGDAVSYYSESGGNDYNTTSHWSTFWANVSSEPLNTRPSNFDTDNDGMADVWETDVFGNLTKDGNGDADGDGYTDLEEYLNGIDTQNTGNGQVSTGGDVNICEGSSTTLTATGSQSYVWDTGETTQSITVQPIQTTTYTVIGTDSEGNESTDSVTVTVNPLPIANAGEDEDICQNESITLSASGGENYEWNTGQTTQSITVSPNDTTTYTVTVTINGCSDSDDVTVTVNPSPQVNAGNDIDIYLSESITLTATGEGTFVWDTGEDTASITVSPVETTTYTVFANLNGCSSSDSVTVTVLEPDTVNANAGEDKSICENESVTLTASGGPSYLWSTGETTQSITVSPTITTTYSVTVFNDFNSDSDDVIVNVNPYPTASAGGDRAILSGDSITLSASGGSEFIWSTGETTQEIVVEPVETTTYTVEVIENGCSDMASVTVIVGVSASVGGESTICQGESTTLYAAGGSYYEWSTGETTQSIEVSPTQTTTYTVIVSNNTSSDEAEITVNVNLVPDADAGEDVTIESGQNVTLTASGGNTYLWSNGATTQNISVSPTDTTTYTVESIINGCSASDDVKVTVVQQVNASAGEDIQICLGESVDLTATGGLYFTWDTGVETASITVSPDETTVYTVTVSNGFSSQTAEVVVTVEACQSQNNLPQNFGNEIRVYPNPTDGQVNVTLGGIENVSSIYISDMTGKVISSEIVETNGGHVINKQYDFSSFNKGIYLITFKQSGVPAITKKLIVR